MRYHDDCEALTLKKDTGFAERLKELRTKKGLSAIALAIDANIPYSTYIKYESNKATPTAPVIIAIAKALQISTDELLGYSLNNESEQANDCMAWITTVLARRDLLEQLAEECNELSQASLKLIRACNYSKNVTPITPAKALDNYAEEIKDVLMVLTALNVDVVGLAKNVKHNPKWKRWAKRLGYGDRCENCILNGCPYNDKTFCDNSRENIKYVDENGDELR